jgi:transposase
VSYASVARGVRARKKSDQTAERRKPGPQTRLAEKDLKVCKQRLKAQSETGKALSRTCLRQFVGQHTRTRGTPWEPSASSSSRILDTCGFSYQKTIPTPIERFRPTIPKEVKHFRFNANFFPLHKLWVVDETHLTTAMVPTRSFATSGSSGAHVATPNNVRGPGFTFVLAVRGDGKDHVTMFIPNHVAQKQGAKSRKGSRGTLTQCFVEKLYGTCSCRIKPVKGMSETHWTHFVAKMLAPRMTYGSALILDQLQCHCKAATGALLKKRRSFPLYMYSKTLPECSPLDAGLFAVFKSRFRSELSKVDVSGRNLESVFRVTNSALAWTLPSVEQFFLHCGYGLAFRRTTKPPRTSTCSLTLPFGKIPVGAKLTRGQVSYLNRTRGGKAIMKAVNNK